MSEQLWRVVTGGGEWQVLRHCHDEHGAQAMLTQLNQTQPDDPHWIETAHLQWERTT